MPDMRDAIAQYLAYTQPSQGFGGQMPRGGLPGMQGQALPLEAYQQLPSGQYLPNMLSDTWVPPGAQTPPSPDYAGPQPTNAPPMPMQGMPDDTIPPGVPQMPPIGTPMQAPMDPGIIPPGVPQAGPPQGPQIGGMDPNEWYRLYTGGPGGGGGFTPGGQYGY